MSNRYQSFAVGQDEAPRDDSQNPWLQPQHTAFVFRTPQDVTDAMSNPLYATNKQFREAVAVVLSRSPGIAGGPQINTGGLVTSRAQARADEDKRIAHEQALALFSDPRYQTSALYRRQVEDQLRAADAAAIDTALGYSVANRVAPPGRIQLTEQDYNETKARLAKEKTDKREALAMEAAQAAYDRAMNGGSSDDSSEEGRNGDE